MNFLSTGLKFSKMLLLDLDIKMLIFQSHSKKLEWNYWPEVVFFNFTYSCYYHDYFEAFFNWDNKFQNEEWSKIEHFFFHFIQIWKMLQYVVRNEIRFNIKDVNAQIVDSILIASLFLIFFLLVSRKMFWRFF